MRVVRLDQLQQFAAVNLLSDPGAVGGPVLIPSCAQIKLYWNQEDGKIGHNVLYGRYSGPFAGTPTQAQGILSALTTGAAWTGLAAFLATSTQLSNVSIRNVAIEDQAEIFNTAAGPFGTSASAALPNETACVITLHTAKAGQSGRGRMYVPGFATNALGAGNVISATTVTAVSNWGATIGGALNTQGYVFVLGLRERQAYVGATGTQHPDRPATSEPITQASVKDNHWDSQRRRGLK
jgi:hypothetical protein